MWNAASYQQSDNLRKTTDWQLKDNSRHCREQIGKREEEAVEIEREREAEAEEIERE